MTELAALATEDALEQLLMVEADLRATLGVYRGKDGRNVTVQALRQRLAFVRGLVEQCTRANARR